MYFRRPCYQARNVNKTSVQVLLQQRDLPLKKKTSHYMVIIIIIIIIAIYLLTHYNTIIKTHS